VSQISQENAYIFRITHLDNVPWILRNGIHCRNSSVRDPNFRAIGDPDLIEKRSNRQVPIGPGGTLSDYVPFYFTPHSPMLYNIKTGRRVAVVPMAEIVILASSIPKLVETGTPFVYTDRHAYLQAAVYLTSLKDLDRIDWQLIASRDFQRDANRPDKVERYQAEALVHRHLPVSALIGIACYDSQSRTRLLGIQSEVGVTLRTAVKQDWYF
jgi:hypothetical protein